jgi:integrase
MTPPDSSARGPREALTAGETVDVAPRGETPSPAPAATRIDSPAESAAGAASPLLLAELDPVSIVGLSAWARAAAKGRRPWSVRPAQSTRADASFAELVRADRLGLLAGPGSFAGRRRMRVLARLAVEILGAREAVSIDPTDLRALVEALRSGSPDRARGPISRETSARVLGFALRVLREWRASLGLAALGDVALPPGEAREPATSLTAAEVAEILAAGYPLERAAVALAVGAGLRPSEILRLRFVDLQRWRPPAQAIRFGGWLGVPLVELLWVRVRKRRDATRCRWLALPPWAAELVVLAIRGDAPQAARIFVSERGAELTSLRPIISRLRERGQSQRARSVQWSDLRRTWQVVARELHMPRSLIRESAWGKPGAVAAPEASLPATAASHCLACLWPALDSPALRPVLSAPRRLPRRARSSCGRYDPEVKPPRAPPPPLPPAARVGAAPGQLLPAPRTQSAKPDRS